MTQSTTPGFTDAGLLDWLCAADADALDALPFGVIGFGLDGQAVVQRYNRTEREGSGLRVDQVLQRPLFAEVAQCMNNYLVAQRFEDALADGVPLDATLDYVFTLRMRPSPVTLRLLAAAGRPLRFVAVRRPG
jgi:photoactive yellow protein